MEPDPIHDYWIDDAGVGSDGELRCALETFCDVPLPDGGSGFQDAYGNGCHLEQTGSRKRAREDSCSDPRSKACREKQRRDRLNDRPPKSDKASILSDATRVLVQLKGEAEQLKDANEKLQETIKDLKAEKNELRDEKLRLKSDKEKLEQQVKAMSIPPAGFLPPPIAFHPASNPAVFAPPGPVSAKQAGPLNAFPGLTMWQWLPPAVLDTTQDPKLWPPHA
ncbi:hypothetical protein HPP92_002189 [Vanilla planifolia]|uniref:Uncharacterized protein n=1 Tax=Vanilla planifolia TaxID=51239 RepID=A0A835VIJ7_VANPL|nr:hypothetical protein HPP92_002492 [Vanilla planifolia]KAG0502117.1 hypothetical protein HPP92_002189 [Vanilla planifolia]